VGRSSPARCRRESRGRARRRSSRRAAPPDRGRCPQTNSLIVRASSSRQLRGNRVKPNQITDRGRQSQESPDPEAPGGEVGPPCPRDRLADGSARVDPTGRPVRHRSPGLPDAADGWDRPGHGDSPPEVLVHQTVCSPGESQPGTTYPPSGDRRATRCRGTPSGSGGSRGAPGRCRRARPPPSGGRSRGGRWTAPCSRSAPRRRWSSPAR
jgi:hypothetical protein